MVFDIETLQTRITLAPSVTLDGPERDRQAQGILGKLPLLSS